MSKNVDVVLFNEVVEEIVCLENVIFVEEQVLINLEVFCDVVEKVVMVIGQWIVQFEQ